LHLYPRLHGRYQRVRARERERERARMRLWLLLLLPLLCLLLRACSYPPLLRCQPLGEWVGIKKVSAHASAHLSPIDAKAPGWPQKQLLKRPSEVLFFFSCVWLEWQKSA
jgi:hypothetical protein